MAADQAAATQAALADINNQLSNVGSTVNADIAGEAAGGAQAAFSAASDQLTAGGSSAAAAMDNAVQTAINTEQVAEDTAVAQQGQQEVAANIQSMADSQAAADSAAQFMAQSNVTGSSPPQAQELTPEQTGEAAGWAYDQEQATLRANKPSAFNAVMVSFKDYHSVFSTANTLAYTGIAASTLGTTIAAAGPAALGAAKAVLQSPFVKYVILQLGRLGSPYAEPPEVTPPGQVSPTEAPTPRFNPNPMPEEPPEPEQSEPEPDKPPPTGPISETHSYHGMADSLC